MPLAAAGRPGRAADEAGGDRLGEERADAEQHQSKQDRRRGRQQQQRKPERGQRKRSRAGAARVPNCKATRPAMGVVDDGRQEDEIDESQPIMPSAKGCRTSTKFT